MTLTRPYSVTGIRRCFGKPLREVWPEIYDELGALHTSILHGEREGFFAEDHLWRIQRFGVPEDARFTISYSPIPDPTAPNGIGGVLATAFETTKRWRDEETVARAHRATRNPRSSNARASVTASGRCPKTCLGYRISKATSSASIRPGPLCSVGVKTKSNHCMSTNYATLTTRRPRRPAVCGLSKARRPCAWRTVFAIAMEAGAGLPGP